MVSGSISQVPYILERFLFAFLRQRLVMPSEVSIMTHFSGLLDSGIDGFIGVGRIGSIILLVRCS